MAGASDMIERYVNIARMPTLTVEGYESVAVEGGMRLVNAIEQRAGVDILHACGGNARCTTCRVGILEGNPSEMGELERNRLAMESELGPNIRLSCQIHVNSDLKVRVINQASVRGMDAGPRPFDE